MAAILTATIITAARQSLVTTRYDQERAWVLSLTICADLNSESIIKNRRAAAENERNAHCVKDEWKR